MVELGEDWPNVNGEQQSNWWSIGGEVRSQDTFALCCGIFRSLAVIYHTSSGFADNCDRLWREVWSSGGGRLLLLTCYVRKLGGTLLEHQGGHVSELLMESVEWALKRRWKLMVDEFDEVVQLQVHYVCSVGLAFGAKLFLEAKTQDMH